MRNESWYRRKCGWVAIVKPNNDGYHVVIRRTEGTFEDALAVVNEVLSR